MTKPGFRVIDTGERDGRANIAFDRAMIDAHKAGSIPDTIRFQIFPPTALVGRHQAISHEVKLEYCRNNGIGVARRVTGGGAVYFDPGQLGWELVFSRRTLGLSNLADLTSAICKAAARGLSGLGIDAQYRPRNDIVVGEQKICGTAGYFDGDTLFFQGTLLIDMNPADMVAALKLPAAKPEKPDPDSTKRQITTLKALMDGKPPEYDAIKAAMLAGFTAGLGIEPEWGEVGQEEERLASEIFLKEIGSTEFVYEIDNPGEGDGVLSASLSGPGGTVESHIRLEGQDAPRIREALFTGDFFITPPGTIKALEASLRGVAAAEAGAAVEKFFADAAVDLLTVKPLDFRTVLENALAAGS